MSSFTPLASRKPFKSADLQLYCYTAPTSQGAFGRNEYGAIAEQVIFSSAAPGGYTEASFRIYYPGPYMSQIPPELYLFSRVVITRGRDARWIGEIDDSERWYQNGQEFIQIHALGLGNAIRDDPISWVHQNETLQTIGQHEINLRQGIGASSTNYWVGVIDPDVSQIFPDNPAGTWSPYYTNSTTEEVFQDISTFASNGTTVYNWGSEAHPVNVDGQGFPTVRMFIRQRDTVTTHYQASVTAGEIDQYNFGPNAQYCYNEVYVIYNNTSSGVGVTGARDPRLNVLGGPLTNPPSAQNKAPFRPRRLMRDYSGIATLGSTAAATLAQTYLNEYGNPSNKGTVQLRAVRDASGNPIPLDAIVAGKNIFIPELAQPTVSLMPTQVQRPTLQTVVIPGVNQFYIVGCQWQEDNQGPYVTLQLDNFVDRAQNIIAKLTQAADVLARSTQAVMPVIGSGIPNTVNAGGSFQATAAAQQFSWQFNWTMQLANQPSSAIVTTLSLVNGNSQFINHLTVYGGNLGCNSIAAGLTTYLAQVTSQGNTLLAVDGQKGTVDWHCSVCGTLQPGLSMAAVVSVYAGEPGDPNIGQPGTTAVKVRCPLCGGEEHFNTAVTQAQAALDSSLGGHCTQILSLLVTPYVTQAIAAQLTAAGVVQQPPPATGTGTTTKTNMVRSTTRRKKAERE